MRAALCALLLAAPAAGSSSGPNSQTHQTAQDPLNEAEPPPAQTGAAGPDHEALHIRGRERLQGLVGGGLLADVATKNPALVDSVGKLDHKKSKDYENLLRKKQGAEAANLETARFAADAVADPNGAPTQAEAPVVGLGQAFGGGVQQAGAAAAPVETKIDRGVLLAIPPDHQAYPSARFALAVQDQHGGDHRAALGGFETAIAGGRDDARTLTFASLSALNAGDPRKAARWAEQALEKDPSGAMAEQAQAISMMALKRLPREEDPFKNRPARGGEAPTGPRAGESVPELERPLPPRAAEPGLPPEAAAVLAKTNRLVAQASQAYRAGDIKEAAKLAGEALAADPDDVRALQVRAAALAKAGKWEEARKDAERGLDLAPGYVPLLLLRAAAAVHAKAWKAVKADAEAVLSKERANPTAWRFEGLAQAALGDRAAAAASLSRAVQYGDPEAPRLLAAARSLPPGADVVDLVELLAGSAADREAAGAARAAPQEPPAPRRGRIGLVVGVAVLAGVVAGGMILLLGRRDSESA